MVDYIFDTLFMSFELLILILIIAGTVYMTKSGLSTDNRSIISISIFAPTIILGFLAPYVWLEDTHLQFSFQRYIALWISLMVFNLLYIGLFRKKIEHKRSVISFLSSIYEERNMINKVLTNEIEFLEKEISDRLKGDTITFKKEGGKIALKKTTKLFLHGESEMNNPRLKRLEEMKEQLWEINDYAKDL